MSLPDAAAGDVAPYETLPDLLAPGLDVVFVGINPSLYAVARGHYFARPTNRFWPAFSRSRLSAAARIGLGLDALGPQHDAALLPFGIGFTDVVRRPTRNAAQVRPEEFRAWAPRLRLRLERCRPRLACFQGLTGFRPFHRHALGLDGSPALGPQRVGLGATHLYVVPSPSPANAHFTPADQVAWYDDLADYLATLAAAPLEASPPGTISLGK
jgi:TDG/mug DNA glycosylase family protein